jgi:hypothetical protein
VTRRQIRIATVYRRAPVRPVDVHSMDTIRWLRVSQGLGDRGFSVDMIVDAPEPLGPPRPNLRYVPPAAVDWSAYHVVKTLYPTGFRTLM